MNFTMDFTYSQEYADFMQYRETHPVPDSKLVGCSRKRYRPVSFSNERSLEKKKKLEAVNEWVVSHSALASGDWKGIMTTWIHTRMLDELSPVHKAIALWWQRSPVTDWFNKPQGYLQNLRASSVALLFAMHMFVRHPDFQAVNTYLFRTDKQRMIRICRWQDYVVVLDLCGPFHKPGQHGFQIKQAVLQKDLVSDELMRRLLPMMTEVANDVQHWNWGVQGPEDGNTDEPFLLQYSLEEWCHELGNCYLGKAK